MHLNQARRLKYMNNNKMKNLLKYFKDYKGQIFIIVICVIIYTLGRTVSPFLSGFIIDTYILPGNSSGLIYGVLLVLAIFLTTSISSLIQNRLMISVAGKAVRQLRHDLFARLQQLSLKYFDSTPTGELMSRFTNDIDNINTTLNQSLLEIISSILVLIGIITFMLFLNVKLAIVTVISTPITLIISKIFAKKTKINFDEMQQKLGDLNGYIEENISSEKVILAYGMQEDTINRFSSINKDLVDCSTKAQTTAGIMSPLVNGISNINLAVIVAFGSYLTIQGEATVGLIVAFINFARQFFQPLNQLANLYNQIQLALTGIERVMEVMNQIPDMEDTPSSKAVSHFEGNVEISHLDFSYVEGKPILKDINMHVEKGKMFGIIGPTGSGKSTIMNLLPRFYDYQSGSITIDGTILKDFKIKDLRSAIGMVLQDTVIFTGTFKENIKYGNLEASDEQVIDAAKAANIHEYITSLPDGYETMLDSSASELSIGQKQLLTIARTIISNPDILILDEATSNIDTRTEIKIQEAMNNMMRGRTSFVIAHRLKTILHADEIIVLKDGKIFEQGTHKELLAKNGFYTELYHSQFNI
ncbi:ABC transporter ATP-binding protein [Clostridium sp.]|uniref:ABC transporter ATP-binding protein n=2 Tax=Clostridium sp. TaxID=1506 RepID=UPI0034648EC2